MGLVLCQLPRLGRAGTGTGTGSSVHIVYYQTLIKYLILFMFQPSARARTGPRHLADPAPFMGMGPIPVM